MLEAQVAYYLNRYLGNYVSGLDPQSLKVSVFAGDVTLTNLLLKPEALNSLQLPVNVAAGLLGSLKLKVAWSQLGRVPVVVEMERLYILVKPNTEQSGSTAEPTAEEKEEQFKAMQARVRSQLQAWLQKSQQSAGPSGGDGGYIKGFIDVIMGNLQLSISQIHIRYEDAVSYPEHPFAAGVTLERISAHTVDEDEQPTFVRHNPLDLLRKGIQLHKLGLYFDSSPKDPLLTSTDKDWLHMTEAQWDMFFHPAEPLRQTPEAFVLRPVDGRTVYLRRGKNVRTDAQKEPVHDVGVKLDDIMLHVSHGQYMSAQKLIQALNQYQARAPFASLRPRGRPEGPTGAKAWWRYAIGAVTQQSTAVTYSWAELKKMVDLRKQYLPLYQSCITAGKLGGTPELWELDKQLPEKTIVLFRILAYTMMHPNLVHKGPGAGAPPVGPPASGAAGEGPAQQQGSAQGDGAGKKGTRSWWGWVTGTQNADGNAVSPQPSRQGSGESEGEEVRPSLTSAEANELLDLLREQEQAVEADDSKPWSLLIRVHLQLQQLGVALTGSKGEQVLQTGLQGAQGALRMYPTSIHGELEVDHFLVDGAEKKQLLRTGGRRAAAHGGGSGNAGLLAALHEAVVRPSVRHAMNLSFVQHPQDGHADTVVQLQLAPSYVTYDRRCVEALASFFKIEQNMNLTALEAQALARLDAAQKAAKQQLVEAFSKRRVMDVKLRLEAPKVAVPVINDDGSPAGMTLVADFGRFELVSDPEAALQLPAEHQAIYECFTLHGGQLSAYIVDGHFSWPQDADLAPMQPRTMPTDASKRSSTEEVRLSRVSADSTRLSALASSPRYLSVASSTDLDDSTVPSTRTPSGTSPQSPEPSSPNLTPAPHPHTIIPLIGECGVKMGLKLARSTSKKHPLLQVQAQLPHFTLFFSPGRIRRLMAVLQHAFPVDAKDNDMQPGTELWLADADCSGMVKFLHYRGLGQKRAHWDKAFAALHRGRLYAFPCRGSTQLLAVHQVWNQTAILRIPLEVAHRHPNVLAIVPLDVLGTPQGAGAQKVTPTTPDLRMFTAGGGVVLRVKLDNQADHWHHKLVQSQRIMNELAGLEADAAEGTLDSTDDNSSVSDSTSQVADSQLEGSLGGGSRAPSKGAPVPTVVVQAELGELLVVVSGRTSRVWWPEFEDSQPHETEGSMGRDQAVESLPSAQTVVNVDDEHSLIALKALKGNVSFLMAPDRMQAELQVGNFEIEDLLVGQRSLLYRHLATSVIQSDMAEAVGQEVFFEADEMLTQPACAPTAGDPSVRDASRAMQAVAARQSIMSVAFERINDSSPLYANVDTRVAVKITTLYLYCNRPTVAALMGLGGDLSAAVAPAEVPAAAPAPAQTPKAPVSPQGDTTLSLASIPESVLRAAAGEGIPRGGPRYLEGDEGADWDSDAASDSATVPSSMSGAPGRVTFQLELSMGRLEADLRYEEETSSQRLFSTASVEGFVLNVNVYPSTLRVSAQLANARVTDNALESNGLYYHVIDLKREGTKSLIDLEFASHGPLESLHETRVPDDCTYYTLEGHLSQIDVVFLYRYLQEFLLYLRTLLALQPPPLLQHPTADHSPANNDGLEPPSRFDATESFATARSDSFIRSTSGRSQSVRGAGGGQPAASRGVPSRATSGKTPAQKSSTSSSAPPFILLMDVALEAPVITMPRNSDSDDNLELDLGSLQLSNSVALLSGTSAMDPNAVIQDSSTLFMGGMHFYVIKDGTVGKNIIQEYENGTQLYLKRPIQDKDGSLPGVALAVHMSSFKACLDDEEYRMITTLAAENFAEATRLPPGARWLSEFYNAEQQQSNGVQSPQATPGSRSTESSTARTGRVGHSPAELDVVREDSSRITDASSYDPSSPAAWAGSEQGMELTPNFIAAPDKVAVRVTVHIGEVSLELQRMNPVKQCLEPLARFSVANLWALYSSTTDGKSHVMLSLPMVEGADLRPGIPPSQSLAISSRQDVNFLMLQYGDRKDTNTQALQVRLQSPTVVAELGFMLGVTRFVVPDLALGGAKPIPYNSFDVVLEDVLFQAPSDLYLSPESRLLVDALLPGTTEDPPEGRVFTYDGCGHRLVLPPVTATEQQGIPLILVGPGRCLRIINCRIAHAASLAYCVQLQAGARLDLDPNHECTLYDGADPTLTDGVAGSQAANTVFWRSLSAAGGSVTRTDSRDINKSSHVQKPGDFARAPSTPVGAPHANTPAPPKMFIRVAATSMALQFLNATEGPPGALATPLGNTPTSRHASQLDLRRPSQVSAANAGQSFVSPSAPLVLAAHFDLHADYQTSSTESRIDARLQGLRVETRLANNGIPTSMQDATSSSATPMPSQEGPPRDPLRRPPAPPHSVVLEPCSVVVRMFMLQHGLTAASKASSHTDAHCVISPVLLRISPDVVDLALGAHKLLQPLMQPSPQRPFQRVSQFELIWNSKSHTQPADAAVDVAVTGIGSNITFWQPQVSEGYVPLGSCALGGDGPPPFHVLAVAVNSGLIQYPSGYRKVWSSHNVSAWFPDAPEGYVALGCVVVPGPEPPSLNAVGCLHRHTIVPAAIGPELWCECFSAAEHDADLHAAGLSKLVVQCYDNACATFRIRQSEHHPTETALDLRSPMGVPPAALPGYLAAKSAESGLAAAHASPREMLQRTGDSRKRLHLDYTRSARNLLRSEPLVLPNNVNFQRVWWERGRGALSSRNAGISIWRPVPPHGYYALGDCVMTTHEPPSRSPVVWEGQMTDRTLGMPLLRKPVRLSRLWIEEHGPTDQRLSLWRPEPHPGYVCLGHLAHVGPGSPPPRAAMCIRADAAELLRTTGSWAPLWRSSASRGSRSQSTSLAIYPGDPALHSFIVAASEGTARPPERWKFALLDEQGVPTAAALQGSVQGPGTSPAHGSDSDDSPVSTMRATFSTDSVNLLLCDSLRVPVLELDVSDVVGALDSPCQGVYNSSLGATTGLWSYNAVIRAWEPVMEPWTHIVKADINTTPQAVHGTQAGMTLMVKNTNDCIYMDVSHAAVTSCLMAYREWQAVRNSGDRSSMSMTDRQSIPTVVENKLGRDATFKLNFGYTVQTTQVAHGACVRVQQPLAPPPLRHARAEVSAQQTQAALLMLDIHYAVQLDEAEKGAQGRGGSSTRQAAGTRVRALPVAEGPAGGPSLEPLPDAVDAKDDPVTICRGPELCLLASFVDEYQHNLPGEPPQETWAAHSRGIHANAQGHFIWDERLLMELPQAVRAQGAKQAPAPEPLVLKVALWDMAPLKGVAQLLGTAQVPIDLNAAASAADSGGDGQRQRVTVEIGTYKVHFQYRCQQSWTEQDALMLTDSWLRHKALNTLGQRALTVQRRHKGPQVLLPGSEGLRGFSRDPEVLWAAVPPIATARTAAPQLLRRGQTKAMDLDATSMSRSCLPIPEFDCILETSLKGGVRHELLRSNAQLVNTTSLDLEVALLDTIAVGSVPTSRPSQVQVAEECCFENQRWNPLTGWKPTSKRYSYGPNMVRSSSSFPPIPLPPGFEWDGPWQVRVDNAYVDEEGWWYGLDFAMLGSVPEASNPMTAKFVRRRKLVRVRRRKREAGGASTTRQQGTVTVLGVVLAGDAFPLPYDWQEDGMQLTFRPFFSEMACSVHHWSQGTSGGSQTLMLSSIDERTTRLVACPAPRPDAELTDVPRQLRGTLWFAMGVEAEYYPASQWPGKGVTDWKLVVTPPLTIENQLPVSAEYTVWERNREQAGIHERLTGFLGPGETIGVLTADVRQNIGLTYLPDGYQWEAKGPAVVTRGFAMDQTAGVGDASQLPDRFRVRRPGSSADCALDIQIDRNIDIATWLLSAKGAVDLGSAVAAGVPLSLVLYVPLWLVNASHLALTSSVAPLQIREVTREGLASSSSTKALMAASQSGPSGSSAQDASNLAEEPSSTHLQVLVTYGSLDSDDRTELGKDTRVTAPGTVDMLSFPAPTTNQRQRWGLRLKVGSGGWTPTLPVDLSDAFGALQEETTSGMQDSSQPLVIRSIVRDMQTVSEVLLRLEPAGLRFGRTQVMRVEPFFVVSNRTGMPLQMLQCRVRSSQPPQPTQGQGQQRQQQLQQQQQAVGQHLDPVALAATAAAAAAFKSQATGLAAVAAMSKVRPSVSALLRMQRNSTVSTASPPSADSTLSLSRLESGAVPSEASSHWRAVPTMVAGTESALMLCGMPDNPVQEVVVMDIPPGAQAVPIDWHTSSEQYVTSWRVVPDGGGSEGAGHVWSNPLTTEYPPGLTHHVAVPILQDEPESSVHRAGEAVQSGTTNAALAAEDEVDSPIRGLAVAPRAPGGHLVAHAGQTSRALAETSRVTKKLLDTARSASVKESQRGTPYAILRVSSYLRWVGAVHLVLESVDSDPPYLVENRTPVALEFRQAGCEQDRWSLVGPFSALGYVWPHAPAFGMPRELAVRDASGLKPLRLYTLDHAGASSVGSAATTAAGLSSSTGSNGLDKLPTSVTPSFCTVSVVDVEQQVTLRDGVESIAGTGGLLGRGGVDRVLRVTPGWTRSTTGQQSSGSTSRMELNLLLTNLELALVDHTPRELLIVTVMGLRMDYEAGSNPEGNFTTLKLKLEDMEVDDLAYDTRCPVVVASYVNPDSSSFGSSTRTWRRSNSTNQSGREGEQQGPLEPLLTLTVVTQQRSSRRRLYYPYIAAGLNNTLQLAVNESLVWTVMDMYNRLGIVASVPAQGPSGSQGPVTGAPSTNASRSSTTSLQRAAGDPSGARTGPTTASTDAPLSIGLVDVGDISACVSFRADPLARPKWASGVVAVGLNLANLTAVPVRLHGLQEENVAMLRSAFMARLIRNFLSQINQVAFSLIRTIGIAGGTAKFFSVIGTGLASLAQDDRFNTERMQLQRRRSIRGVGDGFKAGAETIAKGVLDGATGILTTPLRGAREGGLGGFVKGLGRGIVGGVAKPVSGFADFVSTAVEGLDVSTDKLLGLGGMKQSALMTRRQRLPRAIGGDQRLCPWVRAGTEEESRTEALGAALMYLTLREQADLQEGTATAGAGERGVDGAPGPSEEPVGPDPDLYEGHCYEEHFLLSESSVLMLSNGGIMLMQAQNFIRQQEAAVRGLPNWQDVSPGRLHWLVRWSDVLCLELSHETRLLVYRKGQPRTDDEVLLYTVKCSDAVAAAQIHAVSLRVLDKYWTGPLRARGLQWLRSDTVENTPVHNLPEQTFSTRYELVWRAKRKYVSDKGGQVVSLWRPIPPTEHYRPLGDVITLGSNPPDTPVPMYRNDNALRETRTLNPEVQPLFMPPKAYHLVWRACNTNPVVMWLPLPPEGYHAVGCLVSSTPEYPTGDAVLCVRNDKCKAAAMRDTALWSYNAKQFLLEAAIPSSDPDRLSGLKSWGQHNPASWSCSLWPINNGCKTFLAIRGMDQPPKEFAVDVLGNTAA